MLKKLKKFQNKLWLVITIVILGCQSINEKKITNIPKATQNIILKGVPVKAINNVHIRSIGIIDTAIIVINENKQPLVELYSKNTFSKLAAFGYMGNTDTSVNYPIYENQYWKTGNGIEFFFMDATKGYYLNLSLKDILNKKGITNAKKKFIPSKIARDFLYMFKTEDNHLVGNHFENTIKGRFFDYDVTNNKIELHAYLNDHEKPIPENMLYEYNYSFGACKPGSDLFAFSMKYCKRIDFIDYSNSKKYYAVFAGSKEYPSSIRRNLNSNDFHSYYTRSFGGEKYLYSFCINNKYLNYLKNKGNMELHIFSWEGELMKVVSLDRIHLGGFIVDEKNKILYCLNLEKDRVQTPILKYDLSLIELP